MNKFIMWLCNLLLGSKSEFVIIRCSDIDNIKRKTNLIAEHSAAAYASFFDNNFNGAGKFADLSKKESDKLIKFLNSLNKSNG